MFIVHYIFLENSLVTDAVIVPEAPGKDKDVVVLVANSIADTKVRCYIC